MSEEAPREYSLAGKRPPDRGLVIVNTGDGTGKSTAAFGTALRAAGAGMKVLIVQFMKGTWKYGELEAFKRLGNVEIVAMGAGFTWDTLDREKDERTAREAWEYAKRKMNTGEFDLVVLDEINYVLGYGFLQVADVVEAVRARTRDVNPRKVHVMLTGGFAPQELVDLADTVTEMKKIKHAFDAGYLAIKGLEF
ncbi:MAG: cob(I)yrinic acid a,c-diamide adenosyltransferase [Acidobacteriota bacterium]